MGIPPEATKQPDNPPISAENKMENVSLAPTGPTRRQKIWESIKKYAYHYFARDFRMSLKELLGYSLQALIMGILIAFWIAALMGMLPTYSFNYGEQLAVGIIGAITILLAGSIVDVYIRVRHFSEMVGLFALIPLILIIFVSNGVIVFISTVVLGICAFVSAITFFTTILAKTTLLNRARIFMSIFAVIGLIVAPSALLFVNPVAYRYTWLFLIGLALIIFLLTRTIPEDRFTFPIARFESFTSLFRIDGVISNFIILIITASTVGFYTADVFSGEYSTVDYIIIIVVGIFSFPIIAAFLDNVSRKPITYLTLMGLGFLSIFFDFPQTEFFRISTLRVSIYSFAILFIFIYTGVAAGDLSTKTNRGRMMGLFLFASLGGTIVGILVQLIISNLQQVPDPNSRIIISDFTSLFLFIAVFFMAGVKETFESGSPDWRDYLDRFFLITKTGIGIYFFDFHANPDDPKYDDLASGGLSGIQQMLQEISHSDKSIQILDQGDTKILFNNGEYTNAVLIVKKDLRVYREKFRSFHEHFEYLNREALKRFFGDIKKFVGLESLRKRYFT